MKGLMLHCGGQLAPREEVFNVPAPAATATYAPLPYESFVVRIEKQIAVEGIAIAEERLALAKNGQRLFGLLALTMPGFGRAEYGCVLGLRTSYDRSFANGVCIGAAVFVCDNLSFAGEVTFERKHTAGMLRDLSWMISETVSGLPARFAAQSETFESMKRQELDDKDAHDLAIRFYDAGAIGVLEIPRLIKEWREPRHEEFRDAPKSAWRLFNAATSWRERAGLNRPRRRRPSRKPWGLPHESSLHDQHDKEGTAAAPAGKDLPRLANGRRLLPGHGFRREWARVPAPVPARPVQPQPHRVRVGILRVRAGATRARPACRRIRRPGHRAAPSSGIQAQRRGRIRRDVDDHDSGHPAFLGVPRG
jgi:hypothetical protein